jgi:hypothetical protein
VALPADAAGGPWQASDEWADVLAAAARWAMAPEGDPRFAGRIERRDDALTLSVQATDGNAPVNRLELTASALGAGADGPVERPLLQVAPGRYEATFDSLAAPSAIAVRQGGGRTVWRTAEPRLAAPELLDVGPDWDALRRLAAAVGGRVVAAGELAAAGRRAAASRYRPAWWAFVALALAAMLADWAITRVWRRAD